MIPSAGITGGDEGAVCFAPRLVTAGMAFFMAARCFLITILAIAILGLLPGGTPTIFAAESAPWSTYTDGNCGIELKYPSSYQLNPSGAKDWCGLSLLIGMKEARAVRWLISLEIIEMSQAYRQAMMDSGLQPSPSNFALYVGVTLSGRWAGRQHVLRGWTDPHGLQDAARPGGLRDLFDRGA